MALEEAADGPQATSANVGPRGGRTSGDPANDPRLTTLIEASMAFNIPKGTLSRNAKKRPGDLGYLRCIRHRRKVYFWRDDVKGLARSRVGLRGRRVGEEETR